MGFVSHPQTESEAARDAQILLNLLDPTHKVKVDGVPGPLTKAAFDRLDVEGKGLTLSMLKQRNSKVAESIVQTTVQASAGAWLTRKQVVQLIERANSTYGDIPVGGGGIAFMTWLLELEPARRKVGDAYEYNASSVNRFGYYGLFQVGRSAYTDVVGSGKLPGLPPLAVAGVDPWYNTSIAWIYAALVAGYLRVGSQKMGIPGYKGPITKEVLYAAYNQGAIGFLTGAKNALVDKGQSGPATQVILAALDLAKKSS